MPVTVGAARDVDTVGEEGAEKVGLGVEVGVD